jgi:hypothetical protein
MLSLKGASFAKKLVLYANLVPITMIYQGQMQNIYLKATRQPEYGLWKILA